MFLTMSWAPGVLLLQLGGSVIVAVIDASKGGVLVPYLAAAFASSCVKKLHYRYNKSSKTRDFCTSKIFCSSGSTERGAHVFSPQICVRA